MRPKYFSLRDFVSILLILCGLIVLGACNNTKYLTADQALLVRNKVNILDDTLPDKRPILSRLYDLCLQKPNSKPRLSLAIYNRTQDSTWFNRLISNGRSQPPVIIDSGQTAATASKMQSFLQSKGYFNSRVTVDSAIKRQKGSVTYNINKGKLSYIRSVKYVLAEPYMHRVLEIGPTTTSYKGPSRLKAGRPYDVAHILHERDRLYNLFLEYGYYGFSRDYILFQLDTLDGSDSIDLYVNVLEKPNGEPHVSHIIGDIYVYPGYDRLDSTWMGPLDTVHVNEYHIIYNKTKIKHSVLISNIFFNRDDFYSRNRMQRTISRLTQLGLFRFANVQFDMVELDPGKKRMDLHFYLPNAPRQEILAELEGSTGSDYDLGSEVTIEFKHKNVFRRADVLKLNVNTGIETRIDSAKPSISTFDFNAGAQLSFPNSLLLPSSFFSKSTNPRTTFRADYSSYQRLRLYSLNTLSAAVGVQWRVPGEAYQLQLLGVAYSRLGATTQEFRDILERSPLLEKSFADQLIVGPSFTATHDWKGRQHPKWSYYVRVNVEPAVIFAEFLKQEGEIRLHRKLGQGGVLAMRAFAGFGLPYNKSSVLPFVKQFGIGGANSVRAFPIRQLGPGSYDASSDSSLANTTFLDQTGDVRLEANAEYRFGLFSYFEGAIFVDAGNIWLLQDDPSRPGGQLKAASMLDQVAIATGFGLRIDLDFLVIRVDLGYPIRDPALGPGETLADTWVIPNKPLSLKKSNLNLAVGYPF